MEFLKDVLGDELFAQVSEKLAGNDKIRIANIADGSYIPKDKFDAERNNSKTYKTQIDELNEKLTAMQSISAGNEALQQQIAALQNDIASRDEAIRKQALDFNIRDAVRGSKAKNVDLVSKMIDQTKISEKDGSYLGLAEQIERLKQSDAYLFEDAPAPSAGVDPHQEPDGTTMGFNAAINNVIRRAAGR